MAGGAFIIVARGDTFFKRAYSLKTSLKGVTSNLKTYNFKYTRIIGITLKILYFAVQIKYYETILSGWC